MATSNVQRRTPNVEISEMLALLASLRSKVITLFFGLTQGCTALQKHGLCNPGLIYETPLGFLICADLIGAERQLCPTGLDFGRAVLLRRPGILK